MKKSGLRKTHVNEAFWPGKVEGGGEIQSSTMKICNYIRLVSMLCSGGGY